MQTCASNGAPIAGRSSIFNLKVTRRIIWRRPPAFWRPPTSRRGAARRENIERDRVFINDEFMVDTGWKKQEIARPPQIFPAARGRRRTAGKDDRILPVWMFGHRRLGVGLQLAARGPSGDFNVGFSGDSGRGFIVIRLRGEVHARSSIDARDFRAHRIRLDKKDAPPLLLRL